MIGGDGINDESNKMAPAPIINFFEWYAISKTEVAIGEGIIIEKTNIVCIGDDYSNQRRNHHPDLRTGKGHEIQSGDI